MVVLGLLHPRATRLLIAAVAEAPVVACASVLCFAVALEHERADVAVVDPSVQAPDDAGRIGAHALIRALTPPSASPFVLYLSGSRVPVGLMAALVHLRPAMLAVRGIDDHPSRLREILEYATQARVPNDVLAAVAEAMATLRPSLRDALARAVRYPLECDSVEALATATGLSDRQLRRDLSNAGLANPRAWLSAARVLHAYWVLRDPNVRIRHVVERMGYADEAPLANDVDSVIGQPTTELRRISAADLVSIVAEKLAPASRGRSSPGRSDQPADLHRSVDGQAGEEPLARD